MGKSGKSQTSKACAATAIFLFLLLIAALAVYFTVFKPKDPILTVNAVNLPSFTAVNSTFTFTYSQYVAVNNPNHVSFAYYESSLRLLCGGYQVGFLVVPAGKIGPGGTHYISATFNVKSVPLSPPSSPAVTQPGIDGFLRPGPDLEVESRLDMSGRVRVLHFFSHHVGSRADCRVAVSVRDGSIYGFRC